MASPFNQHILEPELCDYDGMYDRVFFLFVRTNSNRYGKFLPVYLKKYNR